MTSPLSAAVLPTRQRDWDWSVGIWLMRCWPGGGEILRRRFPTKVSDEHRRCGFPGVIVSGRDCFWVRDSDGRFVWFAGPRGGLFAGWICAAGTSVGGEERRILRSACLLICCDGSLDRTLKSWAAVLIHPKHQTHIELNFRDGINRHLANLASSDQPRGRTAEDLGNQSGGKKVAGHQVAGHQVAGEPVAGDPVAGDRSDNADDSKRSRFIVAIGGSAGSFTEIVKIVSSLSSNFEGSVVIATHRTPSRRNTLVEVLGHRAKIRVIEPTDEESVQCTTVYVGNSRDRVSLEGGEFEIAEDSSGIARHRRIDDLFHSVAASAKANAVGVILSGMLHDGTEGLRAIHDAGGVCMVQDPEQAINDSMPKHAIAGVPTARVGTTEEIMSWLMEISAERGAL